MVSKGITAEFADYSAWRTQLRAAVAAYRAWLKDQDLSDAQTDQSLDQVLSTLQDDKLYVAFVAEFSRGKSELINALFFAGFGQRILPSSAGRTTMCPTELLYDPAQPPSIRLLPIETRASGTTIAEYKGFTDEWTTVALDTGAPNQVVEALQHIAQIKVVTRDVAQSLGLHVAEDEAHEDGMHVTAEGMVQIPRWRHAIINFPHPLLEQGLVILDTPGLNALGAEPELTLNMLYSAHAVVFILAADAGVTKSDMAIWRDHISRAENGSTKGRLVVLNKIDVLWDELRNEDHVEREIARQKAETAKTLNVPAANIFPVSAQKALLGKIKHDDAILARSRVTPLENALADLVVSAKREIVRDSLENEFAEISKAMRMLVMQRVTGVDDHLAELQGLNSKNVEVIEDMMQKVKVDKEHLEKSLQRFQATRSIFSQQTNLLYSHLNLKQLDAVIAETKKDMAISLTTMGLKNGMLKFFARLNASMDGVATQAREISELMEGVYKKFQEEHGLANVKLGGFSTARYVREIKRLEKSHEQFMSGMNLVMTEQMGVIRKFVDTVAARVRQVYEKANRDADNWLKTIMSPMEAQVREHQVQLRRRLESIKRIHKATDTLDDRLAELKLVKEGIRDQEKKMEALVADIDRVLHYAPTAEGMVQVVETA